MKLLGDKKVTETSMKMITMTSKIWSLGIFAALAMVVTNRADAQNQPPPVSGLQVFSLTGQPIPANNVVTDYSASFVATSDLSAVTFVFRHDPGFFTFSDASVADSLTPADNLLVNGDFAGGAMAAGAGSPGWTYFEQVGVTFLGQQTAGGTWLDGATSGYDGIDQTFTTTIGDTYDITFDLSQINSNDVPAPFYQPLSTNGAAGTLGNGIDMFVYAGNGLPPTTVPDGASTFTLLLSGLALVGFWKARALKRATS